MRKTLPLPLIVGAIAVVLVIVAVVVVRPLTQTPGPDATHYRPPTPEELAREHGTPPPGARARPSR